MEWVVIAIGLLAFTTGGGEPEQAPPIQQQMAEAGKEMTGPDGSQLVRAPGGTFMMGRSSEDSSPNRITWLQALGAGGRPVHQVTLDGFWIQKLEVTNGQYAKFLNECGSNEDAEGHEFLDLDDEGCEIGLRDGTYVVAEGREDHPVVEVTWYGAQAYAEHYGMALPTEAQWEYAARGPESRRYPWGDEWDSENVCCQINQGAQVATFAATLPAGSCPAGVSWCGSLDMLGNAMEWCSDWFDVDYYKHSPKNNPPGPAEPPSGQPEAPRVCRGGGYIHSPDDCLVTNRFQHPPNECNDYHGFRCVLEVE